MIDFLLWLTWVGLIASLLVPERRRNNRVSSPKGPPD